MQRFNRNLWLLSAVAAVSDAQRGVACLESLLECEEARTVAIQLELPRLLCDLLGMRQTSSSGGVQLVFVAWARVA